jgi:hypothetical protein
VETGYDIMAHVAKRITNLATQANVKVIFTVIPTAELAYALKVESEGLIAPAAYQELIAQERKYLDQLAQRIKKIPGATYVDLVAPMQKAALGKQALYPEKPNGHPNAAGYNQIAISLSKTVEPLISEPPNGLVAIHLGNGNYRTLWVSQGTARVITREAVMGNGWPLDRIELIDRRLVETLDWLDPISAVDPEKYGPKGSLMVVE